MEEENKNSLNENEMENTERSERLNPLNDYLFMKCMGETGDEKQLMAFLNAVLEKTGKNHIKTITILENRSHSAEIIGDKSSVLDVRAKMSDGTIVNIEVQLQNVRSMGERSLFYWSLEYSSSIKSGEQYNKLANVITVNILGTEFLRLDAFHTSFHLWEDTHKDYLLTNALEMHFIDMVKFRRLPNRDINNNVLHRWLTFFDKRTSTETIKKIIDMDPAIKKVHERIKYVEQDENMLHAYRMHEMAIYDFNTSISVADEEGEKRGIEIGEKRGIEIGVKRGKEEGREEGRKEEQIKMIKCLHNLNINIKDIAKAAGITEQEVYNILDKN
jgi:predicted transposase/invertase (TIGR01784 family)